MNANDAAARYREVGDMPVTAGIDYPHSKFLDGENRFFLRQSTGLTKREHFAGLAMQGLMMHTDLMSEERARYAVEHADDLIRALSQGEGQ